MSYEIPTPRSITKLLAFVVGDDIKVTEGEVPDFNTQHVATFIDGDDKLVTLSACDMKFVAYSGAALSMIPGDVADEMIADNDISNAVQANFYEIMNICSKLMMSDNSSHLRLAEVLPPGEASAQVEELSGAAHKLGFNVEIPKYGTGTISFYIV